jgi:hypothetical protein
MLLLIRLKSPILEEDKGMLIDFELKTRAGQPSDATRYITYVRMFEEVCTQK